MRDAEAETVPLGDAELDDLFAPFANARLIALAVSGGADSLALMVAVARWCKRHGSRPEVLVLTVDHRLRLGSHREAATVVKMARARGLKARALTWEGPSPTSDIEAAARGARYRLLFDSARAAGASHLLTAHHRDDVAETFLLRLQRGAGLFGLAAMRPAVAVGAVTLARPLLGVPRARLVATTAAAGLTPIDDFMNADPRFARTRMRTLLPLLAREGLDPARLAETARRLAIAADAVDARASTLVAAAVATDEFAVARLEVGEFLDAPMEIRNCVLTRLLMAIGGDDYPPRFERLDALARAMAGHTGDRFKRTLAGVVIEWRNGGFCFYREIGREAPAPLALKPGTAVVWDHRFRVGVERLAPPGLTVAALGEAGRRAIGLKRLEVPAGAVAALPAILRRGRIVAVPSLDHYMGTTWGADLAVRPILADRLSEPQLFPDFSTGL